MPGNANIEPLRYEFAPLSGAGAGVGERRRTRSEDKTEAIRAAAASEGEARGRAEAEAGIERRRADALEAAGRAIRSLAESFEASRAEIERGAATLSLAVGRAIAAHAMARAPVEVIRPMLAEALDALYGETRVAVVVHSAVVDLVRQEVATIAAQTGFEGRVRVRAGAGDVADCRIEWDEGGVERSAARIASQIADRVAAYGIALPPACADRES
jgi:flagellar assembly protein FliH